MTLSLKAEPEGSLHVGLSRLLDPRESYQGSRAATNIGIRIRAN